MKGMRQWVFEEEEGVREAFRMRESNKFMPKERS
jgi:hypothetical protein